MFENEAAVAYIRALLESDKLIIDQNNSNVRWHYHIRLIHGNSQRADKPRVQHSKISKRPRC